jgi:hypothetical protein
MIIPEAQQAKNKVIDRVPVRVLASDVWGVSWLLLFSRLASAGSKHFGLYCLGTKGGCQWSGDGR